MNPVIYTNYVPLSNKIKRAIWNICWYILFRPFITRFFRIWRVAILKLFGAKLDWDVNVYSSVKMWAPWKLEMHHGSCIGPDVILCNHGLIVLEENVTVSQYSYLCSGSHDTSEPNNVKSGLMTSQITLKKNCWVGTAAFVAMGVTIGERAVVGATASVYKDVEPYTVVGGNPAKIIKRL